MGLAPKDRRRAGTEVEQRVARFLERRGYRVVDRNFHARGGELDLVVRGDGVLVFCEVRSRARTDWGTPLATVTPRKIRRIVTAARHWLARHGDQGLDLRFDVVSVVGGQIEHLEAAFQAGM